MSSKLKELVERLSALEKAATPGDWTTDYDKDGCTIDSGGLVIAATNDRDYFSASQSKAECQANARLISEAHNALPLLLAVIEAQDKALDVAIGYCEAGAVESSYDSSLSGTIEETREAIERLVAGECSLEQRGGG
jgi:hypothetical protein